MVTRPTKSPCSVRTSLAMLDESSSTSTSRGISVCSGNGFAATQKVPTQMDAVGLCRTVGPAAGVAALLELLRDGSGETTTAGAAAATLGALNTLDFDGRALARGIVCVAVAEGGRGVELAGDGRGVELAEDCRGVELTEDGSVEVPVGAVGSREELAVMETDGVIEGLAPTESEAVPDGDVVRVGDLVLEREPVFVGEKLLEGDLVALAERDVVAVGESDCVVVTELDGVGDSVAEVVLDGVAVGDSVADSEAVAVAVREGDGVGVVEAPGEVEADEVAVWLAVCEDVDVGVGVGVGMASRTRRSPEPQEPRSCERPTPSASTRHDVPHACAATAMRWTGSVGSAMAQREAAPGACRGASWQPSAWAPGAVPSSTAKATPCTTATSWGSTKAAHAPPHSSSSSSAGTRLARGVHPGRTTRRRGSPSLEFTVLQCTGRVHKAWRR
mmetsp:Transcript_4732/g.16640  ORF Transcript_4732/g.16640 Transcript_4732/m.16640 type:complete len:445 (-) Transcript_4732:204-1538(-)